MLGKNKINNSHFDRAQKSDATALGLTVTNVLDISNLAVEVLVVRTFFQKDSVARPHHRTLSRYVNCFCLTN